MTTESPVPLKRTPVEAIAVALTVIVGWLTPRHYLKYLIPRLGDRAHIPAELLRDPTEATLNARATDFYVLLWLAIAIASNVIVATSECAALLVIVQVLLVSRVLEMIRAATGTSLIDRLRGRADTVVASSERLVLLALVNYLELILCFAVFYSIHRALLLHPADATAATPLEALYFSVLTQLTISFGDPLPYQWLRYTAALQGLLGLLFIAVVIARIIGSQRQLRGLRDES